MAPSIDVQNLLIKAFNSVGTEWYIKGIIDSKRRIYTISDDTKLISKVFELISFPTITKALEPYIVSWETEERQTVYPDLTLILDSAPPNKIAIDIKSTYRKGNGATFTLGSYTAYIRAPYTKNIRYPYKEYSQHWIVGFVYDRVPDVKPEIVDIGTIDKIIAPIKNIEVIIWQKWQLASDRPGSGDTANIGSIHSLESLRKGQGTFTQFGNHGKDVFEDLLEQFRLEETKEIY